MLKEPNWTVNQIHVPQFAFTVPWFAFMEPCFRYFSVLVTMAFRISMCSCKPNSIPVNTGPAPRTNGLFRTRGAKLPVHSRRPQYAQTGVVRNPQVLWAPRNCVPPYRIGAQRLGRKFVSSGVSFHIRGTVAAAWATPASNRDRRWYHSLRKSSAMVGGQRCPAV